MVLVLKRATLDTSLQSARYPLTEERLQLVGMKLKEGYTVKEAAQFLRVRSRRTVQTLVKKGRLPSHDLPGHVRFTPADFEAFLRNSQRGCKGNDK